METTSIQCFSCISVTQDKQYSWFYSCYRVTDITVFTCSVFLNKSTVIFVGWLLNRCSLKLYLTLLQILLLHTTVQYSHTASLRYNGIYFTNFNFVRKLGPFYRCANCFTSIPLENSSFNLLCILVLCSSSSIRVPSASSVNSVFKHLDTGSFVCSIP